MGVQDTGGGNYYGNALFTRPGLQATGGGGFVMIILPVSYICLIGPCVHLKSRVLYIKPGFHGTLAITQNGKLPFGREVEFKACSAARLEYPLLQLSFVLHLASL